MDYPALILRWIHILSAIALAGGTFFCRYALIPGLQSLDETQRDALQDAIRPRWARLVMLSSAFLLLSGLWNGVTNIMTYQFPNPLYHGLVGIKLLLALALFFIAARLSGRSEAATRFRQRRTMWLNLNVVLAVALVCTGGVMKSQPHVLKEVPSSIEPSQERLDATEADSKAHLKWPRVADKVSVSGRRPWSDAGRTLVGR